MADAKGIMRFQTKLSGEEVYVNIQGQIDAAYLLECLIAILGICADGDCLQLNFAEAKELDRFAISALVAALRNKGAKFNRITIEGMPVWAYVELNLIGADDILGHQWVSNNSKESIFFHRQA